MNYRYPKQFIIGVILGLVFCSFSGFFLSKTVRFHNFSRFYTHIDPEGLFYPTVSELIATVKHKVKENQILVLIAGSSILRGVGQNPDELWSKQLQYILGDKFKVINFACNAASPLSYGGTLFRILREKYPNMIFVAASYPYSTQGNLDGLPPYNYLFWDAYYKKFFNPYPQELENIHNLILSEIRTSEGAEKHILAFLDSIFYFKDLWNWVSYQVVFPVWTAQAFRSPFKPKKRYTEKPLSEEVLIRIFNENRDGEHLKFSDKIVRGMATQFIENKTPFSIYPSIVDQTRKGYSELFSQKDRNRILFIHTIHNPTIINNMPKNMVDRYMFTVDKFKTLLESLGYHALLIGKNYKDEDYIDLSHLKATGGQKLAVAVAEKIKIISNENNYYQ